jgi:hypothetical protein
MKKRLVIFSLLVVSLLTLTGCNLPFSQGARVNNYLNKVKKAYQNSQVNLDEVGQELTVKDFDKAKLQEDVNSLGQAIIEEQARYQLIKDLNPPQPASELDSKLNQYYKKELKALEESKNLYSYLLATEEYWNQDPAYLNKLENLTYDNLDQLATRLDNLSEQAQKSLKDLENINANETTQEYHDQLVKLYKGTSDFFVDLAQAVRDEDNSQIEMAADRLEEVASSASNSFSDLKLNDKFGNYSDEINEISKQIEQEISDLEKQY